MDDSPQRFQLDNRRENWPSNLETFDEKNRLWNEIFYYHIQKKITEKNDDCDELIEVLKWVGIDTKNHAVDDLGLDLGIEAFRKRYFSTQPGEIEAFVTDIAQHCQTAEGRVNLDILKQKIALLRGMGFLGVFGVTPEIRGFQADLVIAQASQVQVEPEDKARVSVHKARFSWAWFLAILVVTSLVVVGYLLSTMFVIRVERRIPFAFVQGPQRQEPGFGKDILHQAQELPVRLKIPSIEVDASVQAVGVLPTGEMEVPSNTIDVGWFDLGSRPGEKGSAVIGGHMNGIHGETAVFARLSELQKGDTLYIEDGKGSLLVFVVRETHRYDPGYADDVFTRSDGAFLNLITCDGLWDEVQKTYSKRLVVFADRVE